MTKLGNVLPYLAIAIFAPEYTTIR